MLTDNRATRTLQDGIPGVYNAAFPKPNSFMLRAHIVLIGSDIVGREKLTQFGGNRSNSYCLYCKAVAVHNGKSNYCPLKPPDDPPHPPSRSYESRTYDTRNLPLRQNDEVRRIASHIVRKGNDAAAKEHGIKGLTILARLRSIRFPESFPPDQMHLWFENIVPNMFRHYRGRFEPRSPGVGTHKGTAAATTSTPHGGIEPNAPQNSSTGYDLDEILNSDINDDCDDSEAYDAESEDEELAQFQPHPRKDRTLAKKRKKSVRFIRNDDPWNIPQQKYEEMGEDMAATNGTFPAAFGDAVRNFYEHIHELKAAEWKIFTLQLAPIYLNGLLPDEDYAEFINLVDAISITLRQSHTYRELDNLQEKLIRFYEYYEARFYARKYAKLHVMLPVFHQILHVVHCIRWCGPMWVYSQWCGERMCGILASSVKSRVAANRNMAITTTLMEQKNHLPFTQAFPTANISADDSAVDKDGNTMLAKLIIIASRTESLEAPLRLSPDKEQPLVDLQKPRRMERLSSVLRRYLNIFLQEDKKDLYYVKDPKPVIHKWASAQFNKKPDSFKATSSTMRPPHATRSSSLVRYETVLNGRKYSSFGRVEFFFTIDLTKNSASSPACETLQVALACISALEIEMEDRLVRVTSSKKKVVEAASMCELIGLVHKYKERYIVKSTGCLF